LGLKPVVGNVLDPDSLRKLPAAETVLYAVGFDRTSSASKRSVYVDGVSNALRAVSATCARFIYVSSTSVYGQDGGELVDESSPTMPTEENGCICRDAEAAIRQLKADAIILRLAGIYGPGRLLARVEQLHRGDRLTGNSEAWLNLIHVGDAVRAVLAAETRGVLGETYLVCDDRPLRRREYYSALAESVGAPPPQFEELPADAPERKRLNKRCVNRRLHEELRVELQFPTITSGLASLPEARR
jgi:nucleoside-diphosphate-sugar epimerase